MGETERAVIAAMATNMGQCQRRANALFVMDKTGLEMIGARLARVFVPEEDREDLRAIFRVSYARGYEGETTL